MDASGDRAPAVDRVAEIRSEIEAARRRIAGTLEALRFKTDLPARLGDSVGNAASTFAAHVIDRVTPPEADGSTAGTVTTSVSAEDVSDEVDEGPG
jgi:vacuolar-type H+-ATPase catalytic subunit A/Vma1